MPDRGCRHGRAGSRRDRARVRVSSDSDLSARDGSTRDTKHSRVACTSYLSGPVACRSALLPSRPNPSHFMSARHTCNIIGVDIRIERSGLEGKRLNHVFILRQVVKADNDRPQEGVGPDCVLVPTVELKPPNTCTPCYKKAAHLARKCLRHSVTNTVWKHCSPFVCRRVFACEQARVRACVRACPATKLYPSHRAQLQKQRAHPRRASASFSWF